MTDEFTDSADADADAGYEPDPGPEQAEEVTPPNLSEALQQVQATQQELLDRLDGADQEDPEDPQFGVAEWDDEELAGLAEASGLLGQDDGAENYDGELDDVISERVNEAIRPVAAQMEYDRRVDRLHQLAEEMPAQFQDPATVEEIGATAQLIADKYNIPGAETDPGLIALIAQAHAARTAAANEVPATAGGDQGAKLETGVGPSQGQGPELDPQERSYLEAIASNHDVSSRFTR